MLPPGEHNGVSACALSSTGKESWTSRNPCPKGSASLPKSNHFLLGPCPQPSKKNYQNRFRTLSLIYLAYTNGRTQGCASRFDAMYSLHEPIRSLYVGLCIAYMCLCVCAAGGGACSLSALSSVDMRQSAQEIRLRQVRPQRSTARRQYTACRRVSYACLIYSISSCIANSKFIQSYRKLGDAVNCGR